MTAESQGAECRDEHGQQSGRPGVQSAAICQLTPQLGHLTSPSFDLLIHEMEVVSQKRMKYLLHVNSLTCS